MLRFLDRIWRGLLQSFAFALFGLGGWFLAVVFVSLEWLLPNSVDKTAFNQKVIHHFFRLFLWFIETAKGMEFRFEGAEALKNSGPGLVIANHPTLLDVVMLISRLPQADCIVKKDLWSNFFLRGIVASAGYIPNEDGPELVSAAIERVRQGHKVIIFPEGTRSLPDGLRPFNSGFAHIAVRAPCPLWPVLMSCHPSALTKGRGFFNAPATRARLTAVPEPPLNPADYFEEADSTAIRVRKVTAAVQDYFKERVHYGEFPDS